MANKRPPPLRSEAKRRATVERVTLYFHPAVGYWHRYSWCCHAAKRLGLLQVQEPML